MRTTIKKLRIGLCGGGTGGHIYPLMAVVQALAAHVSEYNLEFHYFGGRDAFTEELLKEGVQYRHIATGKVRRYFSVLNFLDAPKIAWSFFEALWKLFWQMPDVVFSKGGPGSVPVVFAAWFYHIPVLIHESDSVPGLGNLFSAPFARRVAVGFDAATKYFNKNKVFVSGNPVRPAVLKWKGLEQGSAKEKLEFFAAKPLVVVVGGSQGAQRVNEFLIVALKDILPVAQVFHQAGTANYADAEKLSKAALLEIPVEAAKGTRYKLAPYFDAETEGTAMAAADVVVGRAGAGTISEISAFGKPAILLPLEGHQKENAYSFAEIGGARVIENENLGPQILSATITQILTSADAMRRMGEASARFYKPDAAENLAQAIIQLAK